MTREVIEKELEVALDQNMEQAAKHFVLILIWGFYLACFFIPVFIVAVPFVIVFHILFVLTNGRDDPTLDDRIDRLREELERLDNQE